jgi:hypothetical protein
VRDLFAQERREWAAGDPVGCGVVYLPSKASRRAYGDACRRAFIDAAAREVAAMRDLHQRRAFIERYPEADREALKARIKELWQR